jgi:hypothetical protein
MILNPTILNPTILNPMMLNPPFPTLTANASSIFWIEN